ncbi:MAG: hypothetical protein WHU10_13710, partial [Fimbriimonadales bacterium]
MEVAEPAAPAVPHPDGELFATEADLTSEGKIGRSLLRVRADRVERVELTDDGERIVGSWPLAEIHEPRVEDLVDAAALVARRDGTDVELIRTTSSRATHLHAAQKRLKALLEGGEMPQIEDKRRVCPRCQRPLPEDSDICGACLNKGKTLIRLFGFTRPYVGRLVLSTLLMLAGTVLELLPPRLTQILIDEVLSKKR